MLEKQWKLGEDLSIYDNLFDSITFADLISAVHCNCQRITPDAVKRELKQILEQRQQDLEYLIENNMQEIIATAMEGRA